MVNTGYKLIEKTLEESYGEFVIEPLEPGYGHTIGNALRRVLYGSIEGSAVTAIKITGVKHKFSTVPGLKENIVDFLLNLKELNLRLPEGQESATIKLSVKGPKEITAADLDEAGGVEVVNKEQYLGSLASKGKIDAEITVEKGMGYSLAEDRKTSTLGVIPTDAIFSPIKRVTYTVESTRVGQQTNLDKLVLKVWTNGSVNPKEALEQAAKILANSFLQLYKPQKTEEETPEEASTSSIPEETLKLTIDELDLPTRIYNSLRNGGIETVEQLLKTPRKDLVSMRNMGGKSISVIDDKLKERGISLTAL